VESLRGGVNRRVVLGFTSGLGHTSLLFGLKADGPASEGEEIGRTRLAGVGVVCLVIVGKACKLEIVGRPPAAQRRPRTGVRSQARRHSLTSPWWALETP
jgi:hypothetical protein